MPASTYCSVKYADKNGFCLCSYFVPLRPGQTTTTTTPGPSTTTVTKTTTTKTTTPKPTTTTTNAEQLAIACVSVILKTICV